VGTVFSCVVPLLLAGQLDTSTSPRGTREDSGALADQHLSDTPSTLTCDTPGSGELEGIHILIVDDSALNVRLCERKLLLALGEGVSCIPASDGVQAVAMYKDMLERKEMKLHAMLMDYHMPLMNGKDAIIAIRALEAERGAPHVPIAAYTAGRSYYANVYSVALCVQHCSLAEHRVLNSPSIVIL
jgi:two-component system, sensor histidine kinase and response regulator